MASQGRPSFPEPRPSVLQDFGKLRNIRLSHLKGNPLNRKELADKIDIATCAPALNRMPGCVSRRCRMRSENGHLGKARCCRHGCASCSDKVLTPGLP
jgi:hypothetical protein